MISTKTTLIVAVIAILSTFYISNINAEDCFLNYKIKCATKGQQCGFFVQDNTQMEVYCQKGYFCDVNSPNPTNKCQPVLDKGDACVKDDQCGPYSCYNNTCQDSHYAFYGESCDHDYQCVGNLICSENKCGRKTYCTSDEECPFNKYCSSNGCIDRLDYGDKCDWGECPLFGVCSIDNDQVRVCTEYYTKNEGDVCGDSDECNPDDGLLCGLNGKCVKANTTLEPTPSGYNCNSTGNACLDDFESCICMNNYGDGYCYNKGFVFNSSVIECNQATKRYGQCVLDNGCQSRYASPNSCAYNKCAAEYCDMTSACDTYHLAIEQVDGCGDVVYNNLCGYLGASSSITIPLMSIFVLVVFSIIGL